MIRRILIVLFVVAGIGTAFWWFNRPHPITVALVEVARGNVESSVANTRAGSVEACQRTRLSPISGGRIAYLGVKKGDHVKKGQVLLRLWNDDQQAQSNLAQTQVASSQKRIAEVCAMADNAEREAGRMAKLRAKGFISEGGEEKARYEAKSRRAACEASRADVAQAQARVKVTKVEQNRTVLVAPFDGIVADIVGELGEYTTPSPPGVATPPAIDLIDDSCLYIEAPMDEVDAPKIRVGQSARVSLDALPGKVLPGHVKRVAPYVVAVEKQARTVDVEVSLDIADDNKQLLVGYSADVEIVLDSHANVLRVPTSTLLEGNKVLLYQPATKKLEERAIKVGITNWEYTEVLDGLKQGDRIVASLEREGVKAGVTVTPETNEQTSTQTSKAK
ncbi:MAG: efflux RND transporter periplasmic adaptor subunit [Methylotenera sp.]|nr:efflux RND transporter periplasmic adaptor subunit [Methylotenera sp.]MDP1597077.1 efflux RND transporter periplasmic adaptor subunit [Methylotenera sp.]MDP1754632.1 efflux RND transporter periplasmic adaptor subunit [Methylotenera sp.]MDP1959888.1 efflux RND transporter periplasmic adaptor subunit [Methylotenera sp.]MDP3942033.1 efflux RND transporter periplasmic adaptor subunit [Methylotenera sp.]